MKSNIAILSLLAVAVAAPAAHARKDVQTFSIELITSQPEYAESVGDFKFGFGDAISGASLGSTSTRKSTNGINKSDERACAWAALGALIALKADAEARGGTAVEGIKSTVSGTDFSSATEFQCISGFTNSRVYFQGTVTK